MASNRDEAVALLIHYMSTVFEAAGLAWTGDNAAEMDQLVDAIHDMAVDEIREHTETTPHTYPDGSTA